MYTKFVYFNEKHSLHIVYVTKRTQQNSKSATAKNRLPQKGFCGSRFLAVAPLVVNFMLTLDQPGWVKSEQKVYLW